MEGKNITDQAQAPIDAPSSPGAQPQTKPAWRGCWRVLLIIAGVCLSLVVLAVIGVLILGAAGLLGGNNNEPAWSPDGKQIAFVSNRTGISDIYVMNSDGSHVKLLTSNPFVYLYFSLDDGNYGPTWSPDGKRIAFISARDNKAVDYYVDTDIFIMDRDGRNVVKWKGSQLDRLESDPAWSPDGCCIAYSLITNPMSFPTSASIHVAVIDSGASTQITPLDEATYSAPAWSPDGSRIVFATNLHADDDLYVMKYDGSDLTRLTHTGIITEVSPAWSPDGKRIAFVAEPSVGQRKRDIYLMDADGSHVVQLTHTSASAYDPDWSPDGKRIVFVSDQGGVENIYVMDADGTSIVQLTH